MEGKWEVVNHKQKKEQKAKQRSEKKQQEKQEEQRKQEEERKKKSDDIKRFLEQYAAAASDDIGTKNTMFSALIGMDEDKMQKIKAEKAKKKKNTFDVNQGEEIVFKDDTKKKQNKPKKQKDSESAQGKHKDSPKQAIADVISKLDGKTLENLFSEYKARFPEDQEVQLISFAEHLEGMLNRCNDEGIDSDLSLPLSKRAEYPLKYLKHESVHVIQQWILRMSEKSIVSFFWFLMTTYVSIIDNKVQTNGMGIKALIQIICKYYPKALNNNLHDIRDTFTDDRKVVPAKHARQFQWVLYQAFEHFSVALHAWCLLMLPQVLLSKDEKIRNESLDFIESLLKGPKKSRYAYYDEAGCINLHMELSALRSNEKAPARLKALLPSLLEIETLFDVERSTVKLFKYLMSNAASDNEAVRNEALESLVKCLSKSPKFYQIWKETYVKNLVASSNLLSYLSEDWSSKSKTISGEKMGELIGELLVINDDLANGRYVDPTSKKTRKLDGASEKKLLALCTQSVNTLQKRLRGYVKEKTADGRRVTNQQPSGRGVVGSLVMSSIAAMVAGAYYLSENCCDLEWCKSNPYVGNQLAKFFGC